MIKKKIVLALIVFTFIFVLIGCTDKATINTYSDPSFSKNTITKLAVFPMKNTKLAPSESRTINRKIAQGIKDTDPTIEIISASEATKVMNREGLTDKWADFLDDYSSSGVPNTDTLFKVGDALGVDGIMQGEIVNIVQADGHYGWNGGVSQVTVRYSILGTDSGKLLWEATSEGRKDTLTTLEDAPPLIEAIMLAQEKIIENLPF
ncbi:MAG: hypothetical protein ACOCRZ_03490 [Halothermotrichaceae bacterium]